jgi:hypothetical protein
MNKTDWLETIAQRMGPQVGSEYVKVLMVKAGVKMEVGEAWP